MKIIGNLRKSNFSVGVVPGGIKGKQKKNKLNNSNTFPGNAADILDELEEEIVTID